MKTFMLWAIVVMLISISSELHSIAKSLIVIASVPTEVRK